jgi:hypothetical protein
LVIRFPKIPITSSNEVLLIYNIWVIRRSQDLVVASQLDRIYCLDRYTSSVTCIQKNQVVNHKSFWHIHHRRKCSKHPCRYRPHLKKTVLQRDGIIIGSYTICYRKSLEKRVHIIRPEQC